MSSNSSTFPASKRRRTVAHFVHFRVSDSCGDFRTISLSREACRKVPFLERKISTTVGADFDGDAGGDGNGGDRRRVALPDGCTVEAFAALLYRVDPPNDLVSIRLRASDLDGSIALIRTADFLLLGGGEDGLLPEMLALCRHHVATAEDAARVGVMPIACAGELSREFTGGRLVASMDVKEATALAVALRMSEHTICDSQARVLHDWLRVRGRSEHDIERVMDNLNMEKVSCWFRLINPLTLKNGARPWVRAFAELAAERPVYFRFFHDFALPLTSYPNLVDDICLEHFVADLLLPFQGRDTTWNEILELLLALWRRPFNHNEDTMKPLLEILCVRTYTSDEFREVLPKLITAQGTWVANTVIHIVINSNAQDHAFGVSQLMQCKNWIDSLTVPLLVMLEKEAQLKLIRKIMPKLRDASLDVQKHVADALASGQL